VTVRRADQHAGQSPFQCVIPEDVLIQLFPPDDELLSLETCRGGKINTLKKVKKMRQVGRKSTIDSNSNSVKQSCCNSYFGVCRPAILNKATNARKLLLNVCHRISC
jgi:hypothetical protein